MLRQKFALLIHFVVRPNVNHNDVLILDDQL